MRYLPLPWLRTQHPSISHFIFELPYCHDHQFLSKMQGPLLFYDCDTSFYWSILFSDRMTGGTVWSVHLLVLLDTLNLTGAIFKHAIWSSDLFKCVMSRIQFLSGHDRTDSSVVHSGYIPSRTQFPVAHIRSFSCSDLVVPATVLTVSSTLTALTTARNFSSLKIRHGCGSRLSSFPLSLPWNPLQYNDHPTSWSRDYIHTISEVHQKQHIHSCLSPWQQQSDPLRFRNWRFSQEPYLSISFWAFYCKFNTGQLSAFSGSVIRDLTILKACAAFFYRLFLLHFHTLTCIVKRYHISSYPM